MTDDALVALASAQVFCPDWPVEHVPASFNEQVVVDVPTLVFAGTLDPITPYLESKAQAEAMPDAPLRGGAHRGAHRRDLRRLHQAGPRELLERPVIGPAGLRGGAGASTLRDQLTSPASRCSGHRPSLWTAEVEAGPRALGVA